MSVIQTVTCIDNSSLINDGESFEIIRYNKTIFRFRFPYIIQVPNIILKVHVILAKIVMYTSLILADHNLGIFCVVEEPDQSYPKQFSRLLERLQNTFL